MSFKNSALVALLAVLGFGGAAFAEEAKWASPNVAGMPGYKEPPKTDEVRAPRPVKDDPRNHGSYNVTRSSETAAK